MVNFGEYFLPGFVTFNLSGDLAIALAGEAQDTFNIENSGCGNFERMADVFLSPTARQKKGDG